MMMFWLVTGIRKKNGAEILEEVVFPIFRKTNSIQKVYDLHKSCKLLQVSKQEDEYPIVSFISEKEYLRDDNNSSLLTVTFAEECLYLADRRWFPIVRKKTSECTWSEYN